MPVRFVGKRTLLIWAGLAAAALLLVLFIIIPLYMDFHVDRYCDQARDLYPGDDVEALIAYVESDDHLAQEKNRMVWTLGELRDPRALPALGKLLESGAGDRPGLVSRYEVEKAISKIRGEIRNPRFWQ
jgi:hypothetical protein